MTHFWVERLTPEHCEALAPHVCEEDRRDLVAHDSDPHAALQSALRVPGEAWAAGLAEGGEVLGAFGWTSLGTIWSMWRPLTRCEARDALTWAPHFIQAMVEDAGMRLGNIVWEGNSQTIRWLEATNCFTFLDKHLTLGNRSYVPFLTKPLTGDLA